MRFIKFVSFCLFAVLCCTSYAHENKYIFIGQNGDQTSFILELVGNDHEHNVQINENGEVYLKVDKIVAIPQEALGYFGNLNDATGSLSSALATGAIVDSADEEEIRCGNRKCRRYYYARPGQRNCPWCGTSN